MMTENQQQQTLRYFREFAQEWRQKAEGRFGTGVNVIEQRNNFVLTVANERPSVHRVLDVGCGTGELCCEFSRRGVHVVGLDFSPEMVNLCNEKKVRETADNATFVCSSVFEYQPSGGSFDVICANGFIEYISLEELDNFFAFVKKHLSPAGSLVVGSRNRLFNAFSLNEYTRLEQTTGAFDGLIEEALDICSADSMTSCIAALEARRSDLLPVHSHPVTGIGVATRHQFTPAELVQRLKRIGLSTVELYPIHYHGVVPGFGKKRPELHVAVSNLIQAYGRGELALLPYSSSFSIHAVI
jgi:2-polyprenyl-3-methyl-5-hydroxy-6-metoxy-1,4-benzoquinol methylase